MLVTAAADFQVQAKAMIRVSSFVLVPKRPIQTDSYSTPRKEDVYDIVEL